MRIIFIIISIATYFLLQTSTDWTIYECLSMVLFLYWFLTLVDGIGQRLVILDFTIFITILSCLVLPIAGYHHFTAVNRFARLWITYMRVPSNDYYSFMLPATIAMMIGMKLPVFFRKKVYADHIQYLLNVKQYLAKSRYVGLGLMAVGLLASLLDGRVPSGLAQVVFLFKYLLFVGVFYCIYSDFPNKKLVMALVFGILIARSISGGMFGELVYMAALSFILMMLGTKMRFMRKLTFFSIGIFFILVLQAVKPAFRKLTWGANKENVNKFSIFADLFQETAANPSKIFSNDKQLFSFYVRFNQGQLISYVLYSVPAKFPYAEGETIATSLAASIVPRVLWPDKPEAGGVYNFKRFLGVKLKGYSANISPFGEAWGNFGKFGGIVFMLFFGLLFNFLFQLLLKIAVKVHSAVLWIPYLFFYSVVIENDMMTMLNAFTKGAVVMYFLYWFYDRAFKIKL